MTGAVAAGSNGNERALGTDSRLRAEGGCVMKITGKHPELA
jgi:hypothetical protein